ncbi:hypothetical protein CYJ16_00700 [Actinotignum timonense]|nr:hypothetical protein CYJ16_00700 [Actinotignum timonense]
MKTRTTTALTIAAIALLLFSFAFVAGCWNNVYLARIDTNFENFKPPITITTIRSLVTGLWYLMTALITAIIAFILLLIRSSLLSRHREQELLELMALDSVSTDGGPRILSGEGWKPSSSSSG